MSTLDDEIHAKIDAFATELVAVVRRAALEAVTAAIDPGSGGGPAARSAPAPTQRGRPSKAAAPPAKAPAPAKAPPAASKPAKGAAGKPAKAAAAPKKKAAAKRAPGEKRPAMELAKLVEKLADYIKANPGQRMEAIGKALGTPTKDLNLPVKKLLAAKKIRVEGQKRATEYFPV
jgi:hypothetical protein